MAKRNKRGRPKGSRNGGAKPEGRYGDYPKSFGKVLKRGAGWVYPMTNGQAYGVGPSKGNIVVTDKGVFVHGFRIDGNAHLSGGARVLVSYVGGLVQINWSDKDKWAS